MGIQRVTRCLVALGAVTGWVLVLGCGPSDEVLNQRIDERATKIVDQKLEAYRQAAQAREKERTPTEVPVPSVDDQGAAATVAAKETLSRGEEAGVAYRDIEMKVCSDVRVVRVYEPSTTAASPSDLVIVPGKRVGRVMAGSAPDPVRLTVYGWVASVVDGGHVAWWEGSIFADWTEAETVIRRIMGYCDVFGTSGTVLDKPDTRVVWIEDPRFSTPHGVAVGGAFQDAVRQAPAGSEVRVDELDELPTIDLGDLWVSADPDAKRIQRLVTFLGL